jgi:hypothetical protein
MWPHTHHPRAVPRVVHSLTRANCAQPMSYFSSLLVLLIGLKVVLLAVRKRDVAHPPLPCTPEAHVMCKPRAHGTCDARLPSRKFFAPDVAR